VKRILREPLLHFLVLGGALFAFQALREGPGPSEDRIVVSAGQIEHLATVFARTWMRPPTAPELEGLVREHILEEAATREALSMGLDRDDTILRRRLRQKLEFLAEDLVSQGEPNEEDLAAFLRDHPDAFRREARLSFQQVYLSRDRRGEAVERDARALLERLSEDPADPADLGDPSLLPAEIEDASRGEVDRVFGEGFGAALETLALERWSGPIPSAYGLHLVRVRSREPARMPDLAEIRDAVKAEWIAERRRAALEDFYARVLSRYEVVVEWPEAPEARR